VPANERGDVRRNALPLKHFEIAAETCPSNGKFDVTFPLLLQPFHLGRQRSHGVLAHHLQRDTLREVRQATAISDQAQLGMRQHVDEARRHGLAAGVYLSRASPCDMTGNGGYAVALHSNIDHDGIVSRTVVNRATADHHIVLRSSGNGAVHRHCGESNDENSRKPAHESPFSCQR